MNNTKLEPPGKIWTFKQDFRTVSVQTFTDSSSQARVFAILIPILQLSKYGKSFLIPDFLDKQKPDFTYFFPNILRSRKDIKNALSFQYKIYNRKLYIETFIFTVTFIDDEPSQLAFTCSELTIETLEQGVKYVQSQQ